jgi:hypothetical protein
VHQHINDQSHCVFLPDGESVVDFIGATESIEGDWKAVLGEINKRAGTAFPAEVQQIVPRGTGRDISAGVLNTCESASRRLDDSIMFNIASQYAMDIDRYGYL